MLKAWEAACRDPPTGSVIVLENVRWHLEEEGKIKNKEGEEVVLSSLADTHSIVFLDTKINQSKLGCGEIRNGNVNTQG